MDLDSEEQVDPELWSILSAYQAGSSTYKLSSYERFPPLISFFSLSLHVPY